MCRLAFAVVLVLVGFALGGCGVPRAPGAPANPAHPANPAGDPPAGAGLPAGAPPLSDLAAWQSDEVGDGIWLRQRWCERLFSGPQSLTVLDVPAGAGHLDVLAPGGRRLTSAIGQEAGALAAINGGFFAIAATGAPLGLLRIDGVLQVPADPAQGSVGMAADGRVLVESRPAGDWPEVDDALGAGPLLLRAGQLQHDPRERARRHPRSAIGTRPDGSVLWLTVDGRTDRALGMTFAETAQVLQALGCTEALNLDGGGSTTLWVAGRGVCNYPCDNKRYDHAGERRVPTAIVLRAPAVVVVDDDAATLHGASWQQRTDAVGHHGADFAVSDGEGRAEFVATLPFGGRWRVLAWMPASGVGEVRWRAAVGAAPLVRRAGLPGQWTELGSLELAAPGAAAVTLQGDGGPWLADAVRFVQVPAPRPASAAASR